VSRAAPTAVAVVLAAATLAVLAIVLLPRPGARATRARTAARADALRPTLGVARTRAGRVLVNAHGRTLYLFLKDRDGRSHCTGKCTRVWPPALVSGRPTVGRGLQTSIVGTVRRSDGARQIAYNGHPLYTLTADSGPGQTSGQGFQGTWYVVSPAGRPIVPGGVPPPAGY